MSKSSCWLRSFCQVHILQLSTTEHLGWVLTASTLSDLCGVQIGTTKGTGGDVLVLEEAAYCDEGFCYETVAPILSVGSASLVAILTLTSEINFYTRLIKIRNPSPTAHSLPCAVLSSRASSARRMERRTSVCTCYTSSRVGSRRSATANSRSWSVGACCCCVCL